MRSRSPTLEIIFVQDDYIRIEVERRRCRSHEPNAKQSYQLLPPHLVLIDDRELFVLNASMGNFISSTPDAQSITSRMGLEITSDTPIGGAAIRLGL